jgi:hypothetical protein
MNLRDEKQRDRLSRAMDSSYRTLEPFRNLIRGLVEEYAPSGYCQAGGEVRRETLLNLLEQATTGYLMALVANRPRVIVTPKRVELKPFANQGQIALNNLIVEICLEKTLKRAVLDAFFGIGIVKMHMASSIPVMVEEGVWMDPGIPFASNVPLDNFCYDVTATEWHKRKFSADSYRIAFEELKNPDLFDQSVVRDLRPTARTAVSQDRLEEISRGYETDDNELVPMIDLMDVWIPDDGMIYTFAMDPVKRFTTKFGPVAQMEWTGHEFGNHKILCFAQVPENIMPFGPASQLFGLHRLANAVLRKQGRQARRQKDVHTYTPAGADSAKNIQKASDGDWVCVADTADIGFMKQQGADPGNQVFFGSLVDLFDRAAGNLQAILGLGQQAETLGQEQLIQAAANQRIAHMQYEVADFTRSMIRDLWHLLWNDQAKVIPGTYEIPGAPGYSVDVTWVPGDREGDILDYDVDIDVYSMPYRSPTQRLKTILHVLTQVYLPMMPQIIQQGGMLDFQVLNETIAELSNEDRFRELLRFGAPLPAMGEEPGMPNATSREYVRRNVPSGAAQQNSAQTQMQQWLMSQQGDTAA